MRPEGNGNDERNAPPEFPGASFDVVAILASAGGLEALSLVLGALPSDFPAAVAIVQHLDPRHRSMMADILTRRSAMPAKQAQEGEKLRPGVIFLAPPNFHLLVNPDGTLSLSQTALVHFVRPSGDLLFESLAASYRHRVIAVVLTGTGIDGRMGVEAVHAMGGTVLAQDPRTAAFTGMPENAIRSGAVDFVLPLEDVGPALVRLVKGED